MKTLVVPDMQFANVDGTSDALYVELSLTLKKFVYKKLVHLYALGTDCEDPELCHEIENYLSEQVRAIKDMASYVRMSSVWALATACGILTSRSATLPKPCKCDSHLPTAH